LAKELKQPKCFLVCAADGRPTGHAIHAYTEKQAASLAKKKGFPLNDPLYLRENAQCDPLSGKKCVYIVDSRVVYSKVITIASAIIKRYKSQRKPRRKSKPKRKPTKAAQTSLFDPPEASS